MKEEYAIGIMSGTSLDGLDLCYCKFSFEKVYHYEILKTQTIPYSEAWRKRLHTAFIHKEDLIFLDIEYGQFLGNEVQKFIHKNNIKKLDFIASHGHTIFHEPKKGITVQLGLGEEISKITGKKVIYDFRVQDVKMGGQGAPLVPIGDQLLFSQYEACLNLGGFSNISFEKKNQRIAFDISPANIVLNKHAQKLGYLYDDKGHIARNTKTDFFLLDKLNKLMYYKQKAPKSLSLEWVEKYINPLLDGVSHEIILATFSFHIAQQILKVCQKNHLKSVLITGGGAYNEYIISLLKTNENIDFILPNHNLIQFKEALIFAFMGYLKIHQKNNVFSSVTGAPKDHSSGKVTHFWA